MSDARRDPASGRAGDDSAQIQSHLNDPREQLQDELADFFFQADEEAFCSEKLDALLDALDAADPLPETEAFDTEKSLERFHEKYAPLFNALNADTAAVPVSSPGKKHSNRALFKLLPIAAVLVLLLGSVTAQAFGWNIFGAIARWTSEIFQLGNSSTPYATIQVNPLEKGEEAYYDTLEEAVEAFGITAPIVPKWIPERFELTKVTATNKTGGVFICADYISGDDILQIRYKEMKNVDFSSLEQEGSEVESYSIGEYRHYLLTDMDREKAFWQNEKLECVVAGNVSRKESKDIIDSIYEGD